MNIMLALHQIFMEGSLDEAGGWPLPASEDTPK